MAEATAGDAGLGFGLAFTLQDNFSSTAQKIRGEFNRFSEGADKMSNNIQNSLQRIYAGAAQLGAAKALIQPFFDAIKSFARYDSMERGLIAVMGSASRAKDEMIKLREVAKEPGLGVQESIRASVGLQAAGASADMARNAIHGVGVALGQIGDGRVELDAVMLQFRQMLSVGKVLGADLRPVLSRLPQLGGIMKKIFGTSSAEDINKMGISAKTFIEKVSVELLKLPRATSSIGNDLENLSDNFFILTKTVGEPLAPAVQWLSDSISDLTSKIEKLASTAFGRMIIKGAALIASISAIRLGLAAFESWLPEIIKKTGLFAPVIGGIANTIGGLFRAIAGGYMKVGKELFEFSKANWGTVAIIAVGMAVYKLFEAYQSFTDLMEGKQGILTGWAGWWQKVGGVITGVAAILGSINDKGFSIDVTIFENLQKLGIADTVLTIGSWIVRLRQFALGMVDTFRKTWSVLSNVFDWISEKLDKIGLGFGKNTDVLEKWRNYGRIAGVILVGALALIAIGFVAAGVSAVAAGVATVIAWAPVIGTILGIAAVVGIVIAGFYAVKIALSWLMDKIWDQYLWLKSLLPSWAQSALKAGEDWVMNLWNGIKSKWDQFKKWVSDSWNGIMSSIGFGGNTETNVNVNQNQTSEPGTVSPTLSTAPINQLFEKQIYVQQAPIRASYNTGREPYVIDKSTQTIKNVTVISQIDGRTVSKAVHEVNELDSGR